MRKVFYALMALLGIVSCAPRHSFVGYIQGVDDGRLLLCYSSNAGSDTFVADTLVISDGKFVWDAPVEENGILMIIPFGNFIDKLDLYYVANENVVIDGSMTDYKMSGSSFYEDYGEYQSQIAYLDEELRSLWHWLEDHPDADIYDKDGEFYPRERKIKAAKDSIAISFIESHPDSDFSAYLATAVPAGLYEKALSLLSGKAKNGKLSKEINDRILSIQGEDIRQASGSSIYEGAIAPDFTLKTSDGGSFTLSDCRGGYVLLDFWGTWCHWCVAGLPELRKVYSTYSDRLTIVSVDCGDSENTWMKFLSENDMPWIQVYNSKEDHIDSHYSVPGYPGFYLIDPEGKIKAMFAGEPDGFVECIGSLID